MNKNEKVREALWLISTIAIAAAVANIAGCGGSSSRNNTPEATNEATCISNLHQLGVAFAQYEQDYDEHLPQPVGVAPQGYLEMNGLTK